MPELKELEKKVVALIAEMTVDEKISQMMNDAPGIPRLGIDPYNYWNESLHGVGRNGKATVFPEPIGLAATFDSKLLYQIGETISTEARAKFNEARKIGNHARYTGLTFWAPNINIFRDPRWGRGMETYGEDPFLTGTLATQFVKGMQGRQDMMKVAACAKHFAVHSGPEASRHSVNLFPSKKDLWETYLPAFKMLVQDAEVEIVMGAYNRVYGESCSGSKLLLTDILRKKWGFKGHIVSDCDAVADIYQGHAIVTTAAEAAATAVKAGLNVECGCTFKALKEALEQHLLEEEDLDKALKPLLMTRAKLGILQHDDHNWYECYTHSDVCTPQNIKLSHDAAVKSMVLLKNNGVLPLKKDIKTLYVTGSGAADTFCQMGNYYGISDRYCTYLQGIASKVSCGTAVDFRPGVLPNTVTKNPINWAFDDAELSEYVVVVLGNNGTLEGEEGEAIDSETKGDRTTLSLPECQISFLRELYNRRRNVGKEGIIVVLTGGSPVDMREIEPYADALIMAWYPGQEGGYALGDLIFGDANFSGRLPVTFPEDGDLLPAFDDYSMKNRTYKYMDTNVFYPFGYGLSYGKLDYESIDAQIFTNMTLHLKVRVVNNSDFAVLETVQVYISVPGAGVDAPLRQLAAFKQVEINPMVDMLIEFDIEPERFKTVEEDGTQQLRKGEYTVTVAAAAPCKRSDQLGVQKLEAKFTI